MSFAAFSEHIKQIGEKLDSQMPDMLAQQIMIETMAMHKVRIFDKGLNTAGKQMGEYSQKEDYFAKEDFVRKAAFKPQGKDAKKSLTTTVFAAKKNLTTTVFDVKTKKKGKAAIKANHTERKTMFLAKGYSEFRDIQGRKTDHINLKLSGSMEASLQVAKEGDRVVYGIADANEAKKFEGNQARFKMGELSEQEKQFIRTELADAATQIATK